MTTATSTARVVSEVLPEVSAVLATSSLKTTRAIRSARMSCRSMMTPVSRAAVSPPGVLARRYRVRRPPAAVTDVFSAK